MTPTFFLQAKHFESLNHWVVMISNYAPRVVPSNTISIMGTECYAKPKCIILCTGQKATIRIPELVAELSPAVKVGIVCTEKAKFILRKAMLCSKRTWNKFQEIGGWSLVFDKEILREHSDNSDCSALYDLLYTWADVLIVAPASANVIAKSSYGIADNFVLSVMRAWDFRKPCILCPAMNTVMWTHPSTQESLSRLQAWGWEVLDPKRSGVASVFSIKQHLFRVLGLADESEVYVERDQQHHTQRKYRFGKKLRVRRKVTRIAKYRVTKGTVTVKEMEAEEISSSEINAKAWDAACLEMSFYAGAATGWWLTGHALLYAIQYALSCSSGYDV